MLTNPPVPYDFQPGEGPSRGLLHDYEPLDGTFSSSILMRVVAGVDVGPGLVGVGRDTGRHSSSERSLVGCLLIIIVTVVFITDDLLLPYSC